MFENRYTKIEDFLGDDFFIEWVLGDSKELESYWENFQVCNPGSIDQFNQARDIALSFKIKPVPDLSQEEISELILDVQNKLNFAESPSIISKKGTSRHLSVFLKYAAIVTVILGLSTYGYYLYQPKEVSNTAVVAIAKFHEVTNTSNKNQLIKLPDNSLVILQPKSKISYPKIFEETRRDVYLSGEAFFDVTKNRRKPFHVHSNELEVKVLGTSFNVSAHEGDSNFKVTVSTGKVSVSASSDNKAVSSVFLEPNELAVLYRKDSRLEKESLKKPLLLSKELAKIHFNFVEASFSKVVNEIEKAYDVEIEYDETIMRDCSLTASLVDQSLEERLSLICKAVEANFQIINRTIVINGQGCSVN